MPIANAKPALFALSCGNFAIGAGMLIVIGMMNEMATGLNVSVPAIGQLMGAYALAVAVGAPLLAGLTSRFERRPLLVFALVAYAVCLFAAALAPNYATLFVLRFVTGLGAAIFTPQAAATAGLLVPANERPQAVGQVFTGYSLATVAGLPMGAYAGAVLGWRWGFVVVGVISLMAAWGVWRAVPAKQFVAPIDRAAWGQLARNVALLLVIAVTLVQATGQFVLYSYLAPVYREHFGATPLGISAFLFLSGLFGFIGTFVARSLYARVGVDRVVLGCLSIMLVAFLLWPLARGMVWAVVPLVAAWGLTSFATNMTQQGRLVSMAPQLASVSVAFNSSGLFAGQALGAAIGGWVIAQSGFGPLAWMGAVFLAASIAVSVTASRMAARAG
jgi:predicted MFS family arabinose efflux permease